MDSSCDILISVEERHVSNMLSGSKSVELRRKPLNISSGTRVWIYSKLPRGEIRALAIVDEIIADTPRKVWARYGAQSGITKKEFDAYFEDIKICYAIVLQKVKPVAPILNLESIRSKISHFHPPQFFKRLSKSSPELAFFQTALAAK